MNSSRMRITYNGFLFKAEKRCKACYIGLAAVVYILVVKIAEILAEEYISVTVKGEYSL